MKTQRFALTWPRLVALATAAHLSSLLAEGQGNAPSPREISFNRDIRPILSDNCYSCHGPDKNRRKGKLRLDVAQDAYADHEGHIPIVPGKPEASDLLKRITTTDPDDVMPPPKTGKKLTSDQVRLFKDWIVQGAKYEGHWAFTPPVRPPVPPLRNSAEVPRNAIDNFILARLEREQLAPSPEADRRTLIRRLSLDLTGLPPKPEEVEAFVPSRDPRAYEKLVDRLLDSPHYGERMAMPWLDLVRYADTVGYHGDQPYSVWPYRDYVINAFNSNLPFDQFTREQLAGDLLPNATRQQKVASGYNRLNMVTTEGGAQDKEYLAKYAADRVRTTSTIWLGATMGCAECHDHKFDPYLTKDFYRFEAFFADLKEKGFYNAGFEKGEWGPRMRLPSREQQARLDLLDRQIADLKKPMDAVTDEQLAGERAYWEASLLRADKAGRLEWFSAPPLRAESAGGATLEAQKDRSVLVSGPLPDFDTYTVTIPAALDRITALRLEALKDDSLPGNNLARAGMTFVLSEVEVLVASGPKARPHSVKIAQAAADYSQEGFPALAAIDGSLDTAWAVGGAPPKDHQAVFTFARAVPGGPDVTLTVRLKHSPHHRRQHLGRFRFSLISIDYPGLEKNALPEEVLKALRAPAGERNEDQAKAIARYYRRVAARFAAPNARLAALNAERDQVMGKVPSMLVAEATEPRAMRVLPRGNWMSESGEVVEPGVPQGFAQLATGGRRATRLDLANWFVSRENPLAARAFVNRLWRLFFGIGISRTTDDLGSQGEWPVHPELLDWLACEFMDSGWNVKHMVRLLVTSRAYRQTSRGNPTLDERDPLNRLVARQSRFRLDAELVRDNALAISGLLVDKQGGPSLRPYQPAGYYAPLNFPRREYVPDQGENLYRRGLYTHWQRTFLHPSLLAFDAPSREECTVNRVNSNTPQQALVLLNDPACVEAARVLVQNVLRQGGGNFAQRLDQAYARALARPPTAEEARLLGSLYQKQLAHYRAEPEAARQLINTGEWPVAKDLPAPELAAWTAVARAILNLNETITRN